MKKLTVKNSDVIAMKMALDAIDNAGNAGQTKAGRFSFPAKGIYWIGRAMRKVKTAFDDLESARVKLVERYLETQKKEKPDSNELSLEGRWLAAFSREYQTVLETEIELEIPELKLSYFDLPKNPEFPISVIRDLDLIVVDDSPDEDADKDKKK